MNACGTSAHLPTHFPLNWTQELVLPDAMLLPASFFHDLAAQLPGLRVLEVHIHPTQEHVQALQGFGSLQHLSLAYIKMYQFGLEIPPDIGGFASLALTHLDLLAWDFPLAGLEMVLHACPLTHLSLHALPDFPSHVFRAFYLQSLVLTQVAIHALPLLFCQYRCACVSLWLCAALETMCPAAAAPQAASCARTKTTPKHCRPALAGSPTSSAWMCSAAL